MKPHLVSISFIYPGFFLLFLPSVLQAIEENVKLQMPESEFECSSCQWTGPTSSSIRIEVIGRHSSGKTDVPSLSWGTTLNAYVSSQTVHGLGDRWETEISTNGFFIMVANQYENNFFGSTQLRMIEDKIQFRQIQWEDLDEDCVDSSPPHHPDPERQRWVVKCSTAIFIEDIIGKFRPHTRRSD